MQKIAWGKNAYYGYIEEIWEQNYGMSLQITIFKCHWVKHPQAVEMNLGFTLQLLHKCFTYLIPKTRSNTSLFLENNEVLELMMWNTTNATRCLSLWIQGV
jgi:hypothetical protein